MLRFDNRDLDERYQSDYDHRITYERFLHAYDDHETVDLSTVDQPRGLSFGLTPPTYKRDRLLHLRKLYMDVFA